MANMPTPLMMESAPDAHTVFEGRRYLYFGGTSYLGLAGRPEVIEAACDATRRYGIHTATSRGRYGNNPPTAAVERLAAEFFGMEEAFYFVSGYVGNHILVQALAGRFDVVLADESSHFSMCEAAQLGGRPIARFRHCDAGDLARQLQQLPRGQRPLVMTDGVFSTTGEVAPVDQYLPLLRDFPTATILVDDAHGVATIGENGRGTLEHLGVWGPQVNAAISASGIGLYVCGTMSKGMGGFGGIVAGSRALVASARSASHYFDGASAPPSPVAGATAKAIEIVLREPELRKRLHANVARLRSGLRGLGLDVARLPTPIIGVTIGNAHNMCRIHAELRSAGLLVPYVANYSGSGKEGLLRIAVFATHTAEMVDQLLAELGRVL